jgi:enoyl-CoA hydratase/carnithine racemase
LNNTLLVDIREHIATLAFNRPQVRNALDYDLMIALKANTETILDDGNVRAVIIRGSGGAFMATGPTIAFAKTKALMNQSLDMSIEAQLEAEVQAFADCARTADLRDGIMAFVEKRKPSFMGK